jgi:uncharacterized protein (DUF2132 family)
MSTPQTRNPLHGITLSTMLTELVEFGGWEGLGQQIEIRCFTVDPSIASSLKFLRKTPWGPPANQTHLGPVVRGRPHPRASAAECRQALRYQHDIHGPRAGLVAFSGEPIDWQTRNLRCEKCAIANGRRGIRMRCIITSKLNQEHTAGNCHDRPRT